MQGAVGDADPQTGVTFAQTYMLPNGRRKIIDSWIGGTSLAAPLMAGVMAGLVNAAFYALVMNPLVGEAAS